MTVRELILKLADIKDKELEVRILSSDRSWHIPIDVVQEVELSVTKGLIKIVAIY